MTLNADEVQVVLGATYFAKTEWQCPQTGAP